MKHSPAFLKLVNDTKSRVRQIMSEEVKAKLDRREKFVLVDVREDREWSKGHIVRAIHLGRGIIERDIASKIPNRRSQIVLYCRGGFRSLLSADNLQKMGYKNVVSMEGGWKRWRKLGYPTKG
ncbi:MAG TPA: rhodanese-like domain-containing protein [Bacteroidota bacterium]|nr:rhodanese-like domain-containing protein [Bacteroidota bacterium]